ncbi:hypothetical protein NDU88_002181 [Pleurodeles waltl]|uniref:Uncharacterized protein n=1 Tax=Pleurodeles waltl TaxID=8319 RepID=A0AAV7MML1_PLEWA|nr:hypothetical protein NDU88_002181 [Pleurodeles waltl]
MGQSVGSSRELGTELHTLDTTLHALDNALGPDPASHQLLLNTKECIHVILEKMRCHNHKTYMAKTRYIGEITGLALRSAPITHVVSATGSHIYSPVDVNEEFRTYYEAYTANQEKPLMKP